MTNLQPNHRSPQAAAAHSFSRDAAAIGFSITQLVATLRPGSTLVGADRLKAEALIGDISTNALALLILARKIEMGVLPR